MQNNDVTNACLALVNAGKKPTIALVKTKLAGKVPLAMIVKGIQQFQNNLTSGESLVATTALEENHIDTNTTPHNECDCACAERLSFLEKEVLVMSAYITKLQAQVKALAAQ